MESQNEIPYSYLKQKCLFSKMENRKAKGPIWGLLPVREGRM
jgi:hypothetical protein